MRTDRTKPWNAPVFRFVAAACARAPAPAPADLDWAKVVALAGRHRVEGLVQAAVRELGVTPPAVVAEALAARAREIAALGLAQAAESVRLQAALDAAGVPNLILKGAPLEVLAYGRLGLKSAWDIDLLAAPEAAPAARAVLEAAGYELTTPAGLGPDAFVRWTGLAKECVFTARRGGLVVELHWALVEGELLPELSAASPAQSVAVAARMSLRTLERDALIAYLMVHGAAHGWSRLKWLADLHALLPKDDPAALERAYRQAAALGAGACPALALRLCRRLFGLAIPGPLAREMDRDAKAALLERLALDALSHPLSLDERPRAQDLVLASRLLFASGWRYRRRELARQWISANDRMRVPLPPSLGALYSLIRVPSFVWRRFRARSAKVGPGFATRTRPKV